MKNKILSLLGIRAQRDSKFSTFFKEKRQGGPYFSSEEKKRVIQQAIREANREQRELVQRFESYNN